MPALTCMASDAVDEVRDGHGDGEEDDQEQPCLCCEHSRALGGQEGDYWGRHLHNLGGLVSHHSCLRDQGRGHLLGGLYIEAERERGRERGVANATIGAKLVSSGLKRRWTSVQAKALERSMKARRASASNQLDGPVDKCSA